MAVKAKKTKDNKKIAKKKETSVKKSVKKMPKPKKATSKKAVSKKIAKKVKKTAKKAAPKKAVSKKIAKPVKKITKKAAPKKVVAKKPVKKVVQKKLVKKIAKKIAPKKVVAKRPSKVAIPITKKVKKCKKSLCRELAIINGYCRYHYIANWKVEHVDKKVRKVQHLEKIIGEIRKRFPEEYLELIKGDLASDKVFRQVLKDMDLEEDISDFEISNDTQRIITSYNTLVDEDEF